MSNLKDERELLSKPGDTIAETLEYKKMSQAELAERMGKTPSKINDLISGKEPITTTTALQLEKVLDIAAEFWLNREVLYREKLSRIEQEEFLEECKDWLRVQPIKELKAAGYIKTEKPGPAMTEECLKFYSVASPIQWQSIYVNEYVSSNFRKSEAHKSTLGALAAWLRIGEIEMKKLSLSSYNKDLFKDNLNEIRTLAKSQPEDFAIRLQNHCLKAGVALIYTICIPKAPVSGVARWVGGNPLIQLTDRYKSNDHFWITFFHEAGHILLNGKKDVFIEEFEQSVNDPKKEKEADEFAYSFLMPKGIPTDLSNSINENEIKQIARNNNIHSAIVLSYLQRLKKVAYSFGNSLKLKVFLDDVIKKQRSL
jgi:HTH-type transcriptional regulator / antitoxin HigA